MPVWADPETARLRFSRHALGDYVDSAAMWAEAETTRHIGGTPSTPEESWARLLRNVGHWAVAGYGFWVIRDRATGRFMGEVGLKQFRRDLDPAWESLPEIGWVLAPWARGRGMASEAAAAVLAWGDRHLAGARTLCLIDPDNAASLRVAAKCGFSDMSRVSYRDKTVIILDRPHPTG
jgi:RimJ/RimL family protein N-acetyltransferase